MILSSEEVNTIMKAKTFIKNTIYFDIPFSQPIIVAGGFISSAIFKSSKDQLNVPSREGDVDIFILCPDDKSFTKSYGEFPMGSVLAKSILVTEHQKTEVAP